MSTHSYAVCVTIFSNSSIISTGFKFVELHTLILAAHSYALMGLLSYLMFMWWIVSEVSVSSVVSSLHTLYAGSQAAPSRGGHTATLPSHPSIPLTLHHMTVILACSSFSHADGSHSGTLRNGCMFYIHEICTGLFIQVFEGESGGATT